MTLALKNVNLYGFPDTVITKAVGFDKNIASSKYELHAKIPRLEMNSLYKMKGQVLVLPIEGNGNFNLTMNEVVARIQFFAQPLQNNGEEYLQVTSAKFTYEPKQ